MRILLVAVLLTLSPMPRSVAGAEPLDLHDPTPRWVDVAFEVSPRDRPAQTDMIYTPKIPARLEAGEDPAQVVVTIDRAHVEGVLFADDDPVRGSFSDYVWVFDAVSGEVVSASLTGSFIQDLDWGFFHTRLRTRIESLLVTHRIGGVRRPRRWLGQQIFEFCDDGSDDRCDLIAGRRYDSSSGYVYALGPLEVNFGGMRLRTFSPLGEAIFSERETAAATSRVARGGASNDRPSVTAMSSLGAPKRTAPPAVSSGPPLR